MLSLLGSKADKPFSIFSNPHLSAPHSTRKIMWGIFASLLPIWVAGFFAFGWDAFRIGLIALFSSVSFECLFRILIGRKTYVQNASAVLTATFLAFLLPPEIPWQLILLAAFLSVVMGKEIYGGLGQNLFHPSLVGYAALLLFFPHEMSRSELLGGASLFAIVVSGVILGVKKWTAWEASFFYLAAVAICSFLLGRLVKFEVLTGAIFLCAFFFVTDWTTTPTTREGRSLFAVGAGVLTAVIRTWASSAEAAVSSVLLMNALVPLIDLFVRTQKKAA
ncbi:MAG: RnfABCDGE type electron transport complex subunit D [Candidatus Omnitrophica bacterium]|nr:RnfABCDGE type electron transport complex subunit D [Candidatus Omnitrophota bacterium]